MSTPTVLRNVHDMIHVPSTAYMQPPELCPLQPASYILIFDDGNETWSTEPESISNSSQLVLKSMDLQENTESELKRDRNYIVNVTVITEYANVSSTTYFSKVVNRALNTKHLIHTFSPCIRHSLTSWSR